MSHKTAYLALAAALVLGGPARGDHWDSGVDTDNAFTTDNVLFHGSEQEHDLSFLFGLGVADQDWYRVASRPFSSYAVVIDGQTGDLDLATTSLQRLDASAVTVLGDALPGDGGGTLSLDWQQGDAPSPVSNYVRVQGAACGTTCSSYDSYRIRFYETTYTIPRFNNSGTQSTVLLVQNATDRTCAVTYAFFTASGTVAATLASQLTPRELEVVPTAASVPGQSGSVRVTHTCGYGGLSGKAVAVEPGTGFTFDTSMVHRPH